eukprot:544273-Pleurochrysis_carterae.AAC.4
MRCERCERYEVPKATMRSSVRRSAQRGRTRENEITTRAFERRRWEGWSERERAWAMKAVEERERIGDEECSEREGEAPMEEDGVREERQRREA